MTMSKRNGKVAKRNVALLQGALLTGMAALSSGFTGCGSYSFSSPTPAALNGVLATTPPGNGDGACTDGKSWSETSQMGVPLACADGSSINQSYTVSTSYKCLAGKTVTGASTRTLIQPAPACPVHQANDCRDPAGATHKSGDTWAVDTASNQTVSCDDNSKLSQAMISEQIYACDNGQISASGTPTVAPTAPIVRCAASTLTAAFADTTPKAGASDALVVNSQDVLGASYVCSANGKTIASGLLPEGQASVTLTASVDMTCVLTATTVSGKTLTAEASLVVGCGGQINVGGTCQDFACKTVVKLQLPTNGGDLQVPARTSAGICYSTQLMSAIAPGASSLTPNRDSNVISREHTDHGSNDPNLSWNPYLMAESALSFNMGGARAVKLSGGADANAPIQVDNFVLVGIYPKNAVHTQTSQYYRAFGTADSTASIAGQGSVLFYGFPLALTSFGPSGTATVAPLDVTTQITVGQSYSLDVRAEDCGGVRNLSDIFLLFQ